MAYPTFEYSKSDVRRAGMIIAQNLPWTEENDATIREAFKIANCWRDTHAVPMRSVRHSLIALMSNAAIKGITAARLKRMQAIRNKLRRFNYNLEQLQDLGGCRVILPTIAEVHAIANITRQRIRHYIWSEDNYISNPKADGYRSHHILLTYQGRGPTSVFTGRRIELQVRTQLQHSWATAIEAVGLFRREGLKNNQGSPEWLRLFKLMSAEFAEAENCPLPSGVPLATERRQEIQHLAETLGAIEVLDRIIYGVRGTDIPALGEKRDYYLIRYDYETKNVTVEAVSESIAMAHYDKAEEPGNTTGIDKEDVVLVEVDKIQNLKKAYPNYFGDVEGFRNQLRLLCAGRSAVEFTALPKQKLPRHPLKERIYNPFGAGRLPRPSLPKKKRRR